MNSLLVSPNQLAIFLSLFLVFSAMPACSKAMSFAEEYDLSIRAGKGVLSDGERADLLEQNHPILMQLGDPGTRSLIEAFAKLADPLHRELRDSSYLKWKYRDLGAQHQKPFLAIVEANVAAARQQGAPENPAFSVEALERAEVGYAIVEIGSENDGKVCSLFILWPELPSPTWVTVVNARLAGTQEYFQAHIQRLPMLAAMGTSTLP